MPKLDSNPRYQCWSGRRQFVPYTARPLRSAYANLNERWVLFIMFVWVLFRVFQNELYKFESSCKFIQKTCVVFWTVIMWQYTPSFTGIVTMNTTSTGNSGCSKIALQWYYKCHCVATPWTMGRLYAFKCKRFRNTRSFWTFFLKHLIYS
jgi:hypothetical protein